jgi:hypothetical protein
MDEARAVIARLRRIELLEAEGASPQHVLAEVRELMREAQAWARADRAGADVDDAIARCRDALAREEAPLVAR